MSKTEKLENLIEIVHYGLEWLDGYEPFEADAALDTIAHQIACCLCQWFGFESVGTGETREFFQLASGMTQDEIRLKMLKYITLLKTL